MLADFAQGLLLELADRGAIRGGTDEPFELDRPVIQSGANERRRVSTTGRRDLQSTAAKLEQEWDAEVVILPTHAQQMRADGRGCHHVVTEPGGSPAARKNATLDQGPDAVQWCEIRCLIGCM